MKIVFVLVVISIFSGNVFAARSWENADIKQILVHDNGSSDYAGLVHVYMHTDMAPNSVPSCVTSAGYKSDFVVDLSRPGADAQYSLLLASYMAGKK
ncbi:MAG: hypothetical protein K6L81_06160 [Agarilytica sp.]